MLDIATQKSFTKRISAIRTLKKEDLVSGQDKASLTIKNAGCHSFFDYLGNTYFVKSLNKYEETSDDFKSKKGYFIYELTCLCLETGQSFNFEWEFTHGFQGRKEDGNCFACFSFHGDYPRCSG